MDKKHWIIFTVVVVAIFGGIIWFSKNKAPSFNGDATRVITDGPIQDRTLGSRDQKVVLIEYADFQCPGCASMWPTVNDLKNKYDDKLTFVYRHFPLTNIHPNALAAATAAEAAGQQGKFFEMADELFQNQNNWKDASISQRGELFESYAANVGVDIDKYNSDLKSSDVSDKISRDRATAKVFDTNSTPTFILNGRKLPANVSTNAVELTKEIEKEIARQYPK